MFQFTQHLRQKRAHIDIKKLHLIKIFLILNKLLFL